MKRFFAALFTIAALALPPARAITILDTYPPPATGMSAIGLTPFSLSAAIGFTTPLGPALELTSVTVHIENLFASPSSLTSFLFPDIGGNPGGGPLMSFTDSGIGPFIQDVVLTPVMPYLLLPGTTYWIAMTQTPGSPGSLSLLTHQTAVVPTGVGTYAGGRFSTTGIFPPTSVLASDKVPIFHIEATNPVPEPETFVLAATGLLLILLGKRRAARCRRV